MRAGFFFFLTEPILVEQCGKKKVLCQVYNISFYLSQLNPPSIASDTLYFVVGMLHLNSWPYDTCNQSDH